MSGVGTGGNVENILHERPLKVSGVGEYILYDEQTQQDAKSVVGHLSMRPQHSSQEQRERLKARAKVRRFKNGQDNGRRRVL